MCFSLMWIGCKGLMNGWALFIECQLPHVLVGYYMISSNIKFDVGPNFFCPNLTHFYIMQCLTQMQLLCCSRTDCMNNLALLYFFISLAHGIHIFPRQMLIFSQPILCSITFAGVAAFHPFSCIPPIRKKFLLGTNVLQQITCYACYNILYLCAC
jgi:hypothetical protein